jgi:hypothetical protein
VCSTSNFDADGIWYDEREKEDQPIFWKAVFFVIQDPYLLVRIGILPSKDVIKEKKT